MQIAHFFDFSSMSASTISKPKVTSKRAWSIKYVKKSDLQYLEMFKNCWPSKSFKKTGQSMDWY